MMNWRHLLSSRRLGHLRTDTASAARNAYQKDWDRVVFSSAFRRLQDKTQVHSLPENDYVRTRLTHSLEVSSVGRSLGATVGETLVARHRLTETTPAEFGHIVAAACIAHDIGNPPFGHFGEATIRHYFTSGPGADLVHDLAPTEQADLTRFDGNAQGFRVVTRLQGWRDDGGLRLTCATLGAFTKYPRPADVPASAAGKFGFLTAEAPIFRAVANELGMISTVDGWARHPLAYLLEAADDICYRVVDIEDGFKLGRIPFAMARDAMAALIEDPPTSAGADPSRLIEQLRALAIGALIDQTVTIFLDHEPDLLNGRFSGDLLGRSPTAKQLNELADITRARVFDTRERFEMEIGGAAIIETLLDRHLSAFADRDDAMRAGRTVAPRTEALIGLVPNAPVAGAPPYAWLTSVIDYISGMTDSYALARYRRLIGTIRD